MANRIIEVNEKDYLTIVGIVCGRYRALHELLASRPGIPNEKQLKEDIATLETAVAAIEGAKRNGS